MATSNTSSQTQQQTNSKTHTDQRTATSSTGGSSSRGWQVGLSNQQSESQTSQLGGNTAVSRATGQVDADTQAGYNRAKQSYTPSATVKAAYDKLQETLNNKPGAFSSGYSSALEGLYNQIMERPSFKYNVNQDALYQQYKDQYVQQGKQAMKDTVAQSSALTGGYSNSYANTAGNQAYQAYLQRLNEVVPQLQQQAYSMYRDETSDLYSKANLTNQMYNQDYQKYRDTVGDWKDDRNFYANRYDSERNFDYGVYSGDRNFFSNEYWNQRNAERTQDSSNWSNSQSKSNTIGNTWNTSGNDTNTWQNSMGVTISDSNTDSLVNSFTNSSTASESGGGSGGSSGGKGSSKKNNSLGVSERVSTSTQSGANRIAQIINNMSDDAKEKMYEAIESGKNASVGNIPVSSGDIVWLRQKGMI